MFTKMRAEIAARRRRAEAADQELAILRQQRAEERRLCMEETRRRADEEWRIAMQQNAEMHQAMMAALTGLTAATARLGRERSGNARNGH